MFAAPEFIYLDHAATTPLEPVVLEAMQPYFVDCFGNPSSIYSLGQVSLAAVEQARRKAALALMCNPDEIVFTSGATESINLAIRGVAWAARIRQEPRNAPPHIVTTAIEHHAGLSAVLSLERQGFAATFVPPDARGLIGPADIAAALRPETCLVSVMYANNETGAIQPIPEIAAIARNHHVLVHTDAVQAAGALSLNVDELGIDLLTLSAHKFYGPKGAGLLYIRRGSDIEFLQAGGGQEKGRRGGTENVPGAVGLGLALERAHADRDGHVRHCETLRNELLDGIRSRIPTMKINGPLDPAKRLPNNLNITIPGSQSETLLMSLDLQGVAASAGSACTTGNTEPSHVLRAMGLPDEECRASLRFSVGKSNTTAQIARAVDALAIAVECSSIQRFA